MRVDSADHFRTSQYSGPLLNAAIHTPVAVEMLLSCAPYLILGLDIPQLLQQVLEVFGHFHRKKRLFSFRLGHDGFL